MRRFVVEAVGADAFVEQSMVVEASSEMEAARWARAQGYVPLRVRPERTGWRAALDTELWGSRRIGLAALALFAEQLASLVNAGVTLEQALGLLAQPAGGAPASGRHARPAGSSSADAQVSVLAGRLLKRLREGVALSAALQAERSIPEAFSGVVRGAESAGALGAGLASLAVSVQRQHDTRMRIRSSLAYPMLLMVVAAAALMFILLAVVPQFAPLFTGEEHRLPVLTRAVLWLSDFVSNWLGLIVALALVPVALLVVAWRRWPMMRARLWALCARLGPVRLAMRLDLAQCTRMLGTLLSSGVEASRAMQLASQAASFERNRRALADGAQLLREGAGLAGVYGAFPDASSAAAALLAVGEKTGQIGAAALRAAEHQDAECSRRIAAALAALNPLAVLVMGGVVALFIAGIMMGILSINQLALR